MQFREHTLENGLRVIAECNPDAYSTALGFFVNAGARDESDEISGVSHFLEHMVFKGTPTRSAADVNRQLDEIGSHSNAYTSEEHTVYYSVVLPEYQQRAVELLSDILRPSLREEDFEVEKKVILEEIAKYEDQPPFGATDKCMALYFRGHPLSHNVLGTTASVGGLTPGQMREYFDRRYSPGNITLAASGHVDFDALVDEAARCCGGWQPQVTNRQTPPAAPRAALQVFPKELAVQQYVVQISGGPGAEDDDRYASRLLATILGDDSGSRYFWELVDTGLAEYASIGAYEFQGTGILMTFLCCAPPETAANLARILELQQKVCRDGVSKEELTRAKSKVCSHVVLRSERAANRLFAIGGNWLQRREYLTVAQLLDAYQAVTLDDIAAVLEKYPPTINTTVAVGPLAELAPPA